MSGIFFPFLNRGLIVCKRPRLFERAPENKKRAADHHRDQTHIELNSERRGSLGPIMKRDHLKRGRECGDRDKRKRD